MLEAAYKDALKKYIDRRQVDFDKRWNRIKPMFESYLKGRTVGEVMRQFNYSQRTEFYDWLQEFNIPRLDGHLLKTKARKINYTKNLDEYIEQLKKCGCPNCMWIVERLILRKQGLVDND